MTARSHVNNNVVVALVRRNFEKKVEKFGIVECWWCGLLHVLGIGR